MFLKKTAIGMLAVALLAAFLPFEPAQAAYVNIVPSVTRLEVGTDADWTLTIQEAGPETWDVGETLVVDFHDAFDLTSVDVTDVDLKVEGVDKGILPSACATSSFQIVFNYSSDTITFVKCAIDGAIVPTGNLDIEIEIGTNATLITVGDQQINNPGTPGSYIHTLGGTLVPGADPDVQFATSVLDSDNVNISANVDPTITFDLDVSIADGDSTAPYSIDLGTITPTDTRVSGSTDGIEGIWINIDTNVSSGFVVKVKTANGANGLTSTSVSGDYIPAAGGALADGTSMYGLCVPSVTVVSGSFAPAGGYATASPCDFNDETNDVEPLSISPTNILFGNGPVVGGRAQIAVGASISATTPAHADYTDTITFIATGTF